MHHRSWFPLVGGVLAAVVAAHSSGGHRGHRHSCAHDRLRTAFGDPDEYQARGTLPYDSHPMEAGRLRRAPPAPPPPLPPGGFRNGSTFRNGTTSAGRRLGDGSMQYGSDRGEDAFRRVQASRVLVVGAGGIGW